MPLGNIKWVCTLPSMSYGFTLRLLEGVSPNHHRHPAHHCPIRPLHHSEPYRETSAGRAEALPVQFAEADLEQDHFELVR